MSLYLVESGFFDEFKAQLDAANRIDVSKIEAAVVTPEISIQNGDAAINIDGMLTPQRVKIFDRLGIKHTAYEDIDKQIDEAQANGAQRIIFNVSSGGGNVQGMLPIMKKIAAIQVPTLARVRGMAASAAYMLASQADAIEAESELDMIGSVGVLSTFMLRDDIKTITNTDSPKKSPDVSTAIGEADVRAALDDVFSIVLPHIANGRRTTDEAVKSDFGRGAVMTAKSALKNRMIDVIGFKSVASVTNNAGQPAAIQECKTMNLEQLKSEHPGLFAEVIELGKEQGKQDAAKMAKAHQQLAEASGDSARALEDIANGVNASDPDVFTYHQMKAIKNAQVDARTQEAAEDVADGAAPTAKLDIDTEADAMGAELLAVAEVMNGGK